MAPFGLAHWLTRLVGAVQTLVWTRASLQRDLGAARVGLLFNRLGRLARRFSRLATLVATGQCRNATPRKARRSATDPDPDPPAAPPLSTPVRLPQRFGWLGLHLPEARGHGAQLAHMLSDPEMVALIAAAPAQAGRILRPLCRILGVPLPPTLKCPRSPRATGARPRRKVPNRPIPDRVPLTQRQLDRLLAPRPDMPDPLGIRLKTR